MDPLDRDALPPEVYEELRRLAERSLGLERRYHTLQATALAHEAWMRIADQDRGRWQSRTEFLALAAMMIRRVLVDHARRVKADRRGGGAARVTLLDQVSLLPREDVDFLALNEALDRLGEKDAKKARLVELRFFGGLTMEEAAAQLGISRRMGSDHWAFARAWLRRELERGIAPEED